MGLNIPFYEVLMIIMVEKPYAEQRLMKYTRENASLEEATELVSILRRFKAELMAKRGTI